MTDEDDPLAPILTALRAVLMHTPLTRAELTARVARVDASAHELLLALGLTDAEFESLAGSLDGVRVDADAAAVALDPEAGGAVFSVPAADAAAPSLAADAAAAAALTPQSDPAAEWSCSTCTFMNGPAVRACDMRGVPGGAERVALGGR
jgi:hypothetical protein